MENTIRTVKNVQFVSYISIIENGIRYFECVENGKLKFSSLMDPHLGTINCSFYLYDLFG
ncbi:hypothetical protein PGB90_009263 [Kerria lacca]